MLQTVTVCIILGCRPGSHPNSMVLFVRRFCRLGTALLACFAQLTDAFRTHISAPQQVISPSETAGENEEPPPAPPRRSRPASLAQTKSASRSSAEIARMKMRRRRTQNADLTGASDALGLSETEDEAPSAHAAVGQEIPVEEDPSLEVVVGGKVHARFTMPLFDATAVRPVDIVEDPYHYNGQVDVGASSYASHQAGRGGLLSGGDEEDNTDLDTPDDLLLWHKRQQDRMYYTVEGQEKIAAVIAEMGAASAGTGTGAATGTGGTGTGASAGTGTGTGAAAGTGTVAGTSAGTGAAAGTGTGTGTGAETATTTAAVLSSEEWRERFLPSVGPPNAKLEGRKPFNLQRAALPWRGFMKFTDKDGVQQDLCLGYVEDPDVYFAAREAQILLGDYVENSAVDFASLSESLAGSSLDEGGNPALEAAPDGKVVEMNFLTYGSCGDVKWTLIPQLFPSGDGRYLFNIEYNGTGLFLAKASCDGPLLSEEEKAATAGALRTLAEQAFAGDRAASSSLVGIGGGGNATEGANSTTSTLQTETSTASADSDGDAAAERSADLVPEETLSAINARKNLRCHETFPQQAVPVLLTRNAPSLFELVWDGSSYYPMAFEIVHATDQNPGYQGRLYLDDEHRLVKARSPMASRNAAEDPSVAGVDGFKVSFFPPVYCEWPSGEGQQQADEAGGVRTVKPDELCTDEEVNSAAYTHVEVGDTLLTAVVKQLWAFCLIIMFHPYAYMFGVFYAVFAIGLYLCFRGARFTYNSYWSGRPRSGAEEEHAGELSFPDLVLGVRPLSLHTATSSRFNARTSKKATGDGDELDARLPAPLQPSEIKHRAQMRKRQLRASAAADRGGGAATAGDEGAVEEGGAARGRTKWTLPHVAVRDADDPLPQDFEDA